MRYKFWGQSDLGKTLWISFRNFNWGAIQANQSVHKSRDLEYSRCDSRSIKCFEFQYFRSSFREISTTYWIYICRVTNIITHNTINKAWVPSNYHQILIIIKNKKNSMQLSLVSNWRSVLMGLWATRILNGCRMRETFSDILSICGRVAVVVGVALSLALVVVIGLWVFRRMKSSL